MKVLMTGATGLIGRRIGSLLEKNQHQIYIVSRSLHATEGLPFKAEVIVGDLAKGPLRDLRLNEIDAVIHLAGEPVAEGRWTESKKQRIYNSRIQGTKNLIQSLTQKTQTFISASAIGYYGDRADEILHEDASAGHDFLAKVCVDWEGAAHEFSGRRVFVRTGFVLSETGGALEKMLPAFRFGLGGDLGRGQQWMSWIHIDDLAKMYLWALENKSVLGVYNGVAPHPVTNHQFTEVLTKTLGKRRGPAVPLFALKLLFGEMAEMLVASQRVSCQRWQNEGFTFKHSFLPEALHDLLHKKVSEKQLDNL